MPSMHKPCLTAVTVAVLAFTVVVALLCKDNAFDLAVVSVVNLASPLAAPPLLEQARPGNLSRHELLPDREWACALMFSPKACSVSRGFVSQASDVVITTYPKTGTTFLQQITHQLRSGGDMSFADIYDVQPWISLHPLYRGPAQDVIQHFEPRVFKSHNRLMDLKGNAKQIVTLRDPVNTASSMYEFFVKKTIPVVRSQGLPWIIADDLGVSDATKEYIFGDSFKTLLEFVQGFFFERNTAFGGGYYDYMIEFWTARHDPDVLMICFEDLVKDKALWVRAVGRFMGVEVTDELVETVMELSSKDFMKAHGTKFDESAIADELNAGGEFSGAEFKEASRVSTHKRVEPSQAVRDWIDQRWKSVVTPSTGMSTYAEMCRQWRLEAVSERPELFES